MSGTTLYDANVAALSALLAEWDRRDVNRATRLAHLMGPTGGLNGSYFLNTNTVQDDTARDILFGGEGFDWFIVGSPDKIKRKECGKVVTVLL